MKSEVPVADAKRPYRQTARAAAAEATAERILDAFARRLREGWFDQIRLEDVAADAEVSVQTVIRRFGGKEGLLDAVQQRSDREIRARRAVRPGDVDAAVHALAEDYEATGDLLMRMLAQEDRYPGVKRLTNIGRAGHRDWLRETFAPMLELLPDPEQRLDTLVVATDVYVWKLLRRDMGRPVAAFAALARHLIAAALEQGGPSAPAIPESGHER